RGGGRPTIGAGIVSPAGVQQHEVFIKSPPNNHFTVSPHCRVIEATTGSVGRGGGRRAIRAGIVSPPGVEAHEVFISSTPDDHFTVSPHCCVIEATTGCV